LENDHHIKCLDALETVLNNFSFKCILNEKDIEGYILAFSFYLSAGDDAYRYHTAFLEQKHSDFQVFLRKAKEKQTRLDKFIVKLKRCEKIGQWRKDHPTQENEMRISIDDFCEGSLSGAISLCKEVSIEGAQWGKNIITVHFRKRTASFFCPESDKELERVVEILLSLVTDSGEREE